MRLAYQFQSQKVKGQGHQAHQCWHILRHIFQSELTAYRWLLLFGVFLGHFRISLHQTHMHILMSDRNIVTEPNFRKSLYKSRILSPKDSFFCPFRSSKQQPFAAGRSIDSDHRWRLVPPTDKRSTRLMPNPINRKRIVVVVYRKNWQEGTPRHVRHWAPVSRSNVKVTSSHRLYVSSISLLHSENKMLYLCDYRRAEAYCIGQSRRPHSLFIIIIVFFFSGISCGPCNKFYYRAWAYWRAILI